jgi:hypothetical protein
VDRTTNKLLILSSQARGAVSCPLALHLAVYLTYSYFKTAVQALGWRAHGGIAEHKAFVYVLFISRIWKRSVLISREAEQAKARKIANEKREKVRAARMMRAQVPHIRIPRKGPDSRYEMREDSDACYCKDCYDSDREMYELVSRSNDLVLEQGTDLASTGPRRVLPPTSAFVIPSINLIIKSVT